MTHVVEPRKRSLAPGVSRRVFIGVASAVVLFLTGIVIATIAITDNIVNNAHDDVVNGLCLFIQDTPSTVPLAATIREQYGCPPYKATIQPGGITQPSQQPAQRSAAPGSTTQPTSGAPRTQGDGQPPLRTATQGAGQAPGTTRVQREPGRTSTRVVQQPGRSTRTVTQPPRSQPTTATPTPGLLGGVCQLVGIKAPCASIGLN